jgi:hypothetical protein
MTHENRQHKTDTLQAQSGSKSVKKGLHIALFDTQNWRPCNPQNVTIESHFANKQKKYFTHFSAVLPSSKNEIKSMAEVTWMAHSLTTIFIIQKTSIL